MFLQDWNFSESALDQNKIVNVAAKFVNKYVLIKLEKL